MNIYEIAKKEIQDRAVFTNSEIIVLWQNEDGSKKVFIKVESEDLNVYVSGKSAGWKAGGLMMNMETFTPYWDFTSKEYEYKRWVNRVK